MVADNPEVELVSRLTGKTLSDFSAMVVLRLAGALLHAQAVFVEDIEEAMRILDALPVVYQEPKNDEDTLVFMWMPTKNDAGNRQILKIGQIRNNKFVIRIDDITHDEESPTSIISALAEIFSIVDGELRRIGEKESFEELLYAAAKRFGIRMRDLANGTIQVLIDWELLNISFEVGRLTSSGFEKTWRAVRVDEL
ncbi:MAG: hypothetical protein DRO09_00455 [Thermoprotei archaeon]|nr:MAG: hypothetical protein DRO09_00455 [Thermoprotei archaeon]